MAYDRNNINNAVGIPPPFDDDPENLPEFHRYPTNQDGGNGHRRRVLLARRRLHAYNQREHLEHQMDQRILYDQDGGGSPWPPEFQDSPRAANTVYDIFGEAGHILEDMKLMSEALIQNNANMLYNFRKSRSEEWARTRDVDVLEADKFNWADYTHPDVTPYLTRLVIEAGKKPHLRALASQVGEANDAAWNKICVAIDFVVYIKRIIRFCNKGNPDASGPAPQQDGHPFGMDTKDLRLAWALHRCWIRALHYKALVFKGNPFGWMQMQDILYISLNLLQHEANRVQREGKGIREEFADIPPTMDEAVRALNGIAMALFTPSLEFIALNPGVTDEDTIINWNLEPQRFAAIVDKYLSPPNYSPGAILLSRLQNLTSDFEYRFDVEHIEDTLISKRVIYNDEISDISDLLDENYHPRHIYENPLDRSNYIDTIYPTLRKIMQTHRQRRDYMLIRNVRQRKPWANLWYVFDTCPGGKEEALASYVESFLKLMDFLIKNPRDDIHKESMTQNAALFQSIFPILPLGNHCFNLAASDNLQDDTICLYCQETFRAGALIVKLHCGHWFHFVCLMRDWDHPRRGEYRCAMCRKGENSMYPWTLHEAHGITPEVTDHWDIERRIMPDEDGRRAIFADEQWDAVLPTDATLEAIAAAEAEDEEDDDVLFDLDMPTLDKYWIIENGLLLMSENWDEWKAGQVSSADVEMCRRREERRRWDAALRDDVARAGTGIEKFAVQDEEDDEAPDLELIQRLRDQQASWRDNRRNARRALRRQNARDNPGQPLEPDTDEEEDIA